MLHKTQYISKVDWDGLKKKLSTLNIKDRKEVFPNPYVFLNSIVKIDKEKYKKVYDSDFLLFPNINFSYEKLSEKEELERLSKTDNDNIAKVKKTINHYLKFNLKIDVVAIDTAYVLFKYCTFDYVLLPIEYVVLEDAPNYDKLSYSEMNTILIGGTKESENALEIDSSINYTSVSSELENYCPVKRLGYKRIYGIYLKNVNPFEEPRKLSEYYRVGYLRACEEYDSALDSMRGILAYCPDVCCTPPTKVIEEDWKIKNAPQNMCYCEDEDGDKCVLISIRPEWLCKILNGEKTIEVRTSILNVLKELIPNDTGTN